MGNGSVQSSGFYGSNALLQFSNDVTSMLKISYHKDGTWLLTSSKPRQATEFMLLVAKEGYMGSSRAGMGKGECRRRCPCKDV